MNFFLLLLGKCRRLCQCITSISGCSVTGICCVLLPWSRSRSRGAGEIWRKSPGGRGKGDSKWLQSKENIGVSLKATSQYQSYTAPKQHTAYSSFQQFFVCSFQVQVLRFLSYLAVASEMIQRPVVCVAAFHIFSSSQFKRFLPLTRKCTAVKMMVFNIVQQNMCHLPGLLVLTRSKVG